MEYYCTIGTANKNFSIIMTHFQLSVVSVVENVNCEMIVILSIEIVTSLPKTVKRLIAMMAGKQMNIRQMQSKSVHALERLITTCPPALQ